ncbi:LVIVD repeat-containing protein [Aquipuribacter sp. SD81]|uniref:LVIVD repeat-containing protein n=1 Tax=Aquipuribacter sp. SD81 TaxID=3127703 RepID=UPI003019ABD0
MAASVAIGLAAFAPAAAADVLEPGEIDKSKNMHLLTNIPKNGAFASEGAFSSDLAFKGDYAFAGNYNGFTVYDIKNPRKARQALQVACPGSQNDITVYGDLMFLSVDSTRTDDSCNSSSLSSLADAQAGNYWEGIRIWDISDPLAPVYVKSVATDCGSHTHTLVPDGDTVYVYVSSYGPNPNLANCQPPHDKISIVEVPVDDPTAAAVIAEPVLFPDGGLTTRTAGCHDITAYPEVGLAAGACMGEGVVMDIEDPANPVLLDRVADTENFAFWHSATFNNDATTVMFTDELGGGGGATCNPAVGPNKGANAYYTLSDGELSFESYFKIPREQSSTENCVAHNGSLIPVKGKDVMVQAWYQGGINVVDFTDPANPVEIGHFDRGPLSDERLIIGGSWSAYYYDGYIYSNDIQQGLDVLEIRDRRVANGKSGKYAEDFNPQTQPQY